MPEGTDHRGVRLPLTAPAWVALGFAVVGAALYPLHYGAAVGVTFVGQLLGLVACTRFNVPFVRAVSVAAGLNHAAVIFLASGSLMIGAAGVVLALLCVPYAVLVRLLDFRMYWGGVGGTLIAYVMVGVSWPLGPRDWVVAPVLGFSTLLSASLLSGMVRMRRQNRSAWAITFGAQVPDFSLPPRGGGAPVSLSSFRGRFVLVAFFRGDWCPICQVHMRVYQREAELLRRHGVQLLTISPSAGPGAQHFAEALGIDFVLLEDPDNRVAAAFGAIESRGHRGQDVPLPVSFLVDPQGLLRYASRPNDVEKFIDPTEIVRALEGTPTATAT